jgi:hypothetical protein
MPSDDVVYLAINRVRQLEECVQLTKQLLKFYYLDNEAFKCLHEIIQRENEAKQFNTVGSSRFKESDSTLLDWELRNKEHPVHN